MNRLATIGALAASLLLVSGVSEARKKKVIEDPLLELDEEEYGVRLIREYALYDYQAAQQLKEADPASTRILVTTKDRMPDGQTYPVAEAISEALKAKFPLTDFRVAGRNDLGEFIEMIQKNYDYVFLVGTYYGSSDYDSEQTVYSSRSTGVRCTPEMYGEGVNCNESSTSRTPIGSRTVKRKIYDDIFYATYGPARGATKGYSTDAKTQRSSWVISNNQATGNTSITLIYGSTDASWCESTVGAQTYLAKIAGRNLVSNKPGKFSITVAPDEIGCDE